MTPSHAARILDAYRALDEHQRSPEHDMEPICAKCDSLRRELYGALWPVRAVALVAEVARG